MKDIYEKPMASIIFTVKDGSLGLSSRISKTRLTAFTTAIQKHNEVWVRTNDRRKRHSNRMRKSKAIIYLWWHDLLWKNLKIIKTLLELINKLSKLWIQEHFFVETTCSSNTSNQLSEKDTSKSSFTIAAKNKITRTRRWETRMLKTAKHCFMRKVKDTNKQKKQKSHVHR